MEFRGVLGAVNKLCTWLMYLVYLNILWMFFCLGGLAFFPSTVAMFSITRRWVLKKEEISIFKTFWDIYKKEFWKTQFLGIIFIISAILLILNYQFFSYQSVPVSIVGKGFVFGLASLYLLTILYFFPLYTHFYLQTLTYLKNSILFALLNFINALLMLIGGGLIISVLLGFPALFIVMGGSITALWISWMAQKAFKKVELIKV